MSRPAPLRLVGVALLLQLVGCGPLADRGGYLAASHEILRLRAAAQGSVVSVPLTLLNLGQGPVRVLALRLAVSTGYAVQGPPPPIQLAAGEQARLELRYRPGPGVPLSNVLEVESDGEPATLRVQLSAIPAPAVLSLVPGSVDFAAVASGTVEERVVAVQNLGLADAESLELQWLEQRADFGARLSAGRVAAGEVAELRLSYAPRGGDADVALLQLRWASGQEVLWVSGWQDLLPPD